ncbi:MULTISPECIES: flagellin [Pseudoxanthomonas]|jgi:Flagellin and related hook-associated proteins|uniref:Flagellin n=1 Tax=Pseudoxanthomonas taiwanensis J19 TaxID=935569 RepID=A0A562E6U5_9GAMM|nr:MULTISPECIES: flagellin [Pseudoxanthomonas]RRN81029.1 flagellin [Pseudoxanthomonas sp. SGD-10]TWH17560.1 flagellin [Pseudoxanthomonas taiwanensis J19]
MLSLHTNSAGLTIRNNLASSNAALSTSMTRLGTGYKINSAADDAAGLQIATRLLAQTRGMSVAAQNTQNGISLMQTAEGALQEFTNIVLRMKDLATQAADGSTTTSDLTALDAEYQDLVKELGNILSNTTYGGEALLDGGKLAGSVSFQIGATAAETMSVDISADITKLKDFQGTNASDLTTSGNASALISTLNTTLDDVGAARSKLGAAQNRLTHTYNNLQNMQTNTTDARGRIMDVDYASETANMTAKNILMQAGTSMLKQSSQMSQMVLSLLQ